MFNRIRKSTAILLVLAFIFMLMPAQAETADTDPLFGVISGDTYENTFIGLGFRLEGWYFDSDEEIEKYNNMAKNVIAGELRESFAKQAVIVLVESPEKTQNVNISVQNMQQYASVYEQVGVQAIAEAGVDQMKSNLELSGLGDVQLTVGTADIGGKEVTCFDGEYTMSGIRMYMKQLWLFRDGFQVMVTHTATEPGMADETFSHFYWLP